jgi:hypothetical protein
MPTQRPIHGGDSGEDGLELSGGSQKKMDDLIHQNLGTIDTDNVGNRRLKPKDEGEE